MLHKFGKVSCGLSFEGSQVTGMGCTEAGRECESCPQKPENMRDVQRSSFRVQVA